MILKSTWSAMDGLAEILLGSTSIDNQMAGCAPRTWLRCKTKCLLSVLGARLDIALQPTGKLLTRGKRSGRNNFFRRRFAFSGCRQTGDADHARVSRLQIAGSSFSEPLIRVS